MNNPAFTLCVAMLLAMMFVGPGIHAITLVVFGVTFGIVMAILKRGMGA